MMNVEPPKLGPHPSLLRGLILLLFILTLGFTSIQIFRTVRHLNYQEYKRDEDIRDWMNIGYIAHSYHISPKELHEILGLPEFPIDRRTLGQIAKDQQRPFAEIKADVEEAIGQVRAEPQETP